MKQAERVARIEQLSQLVELYEVKRRSKSMTGEEAAKYKASLDELAKLKRMQRGFESIFEFGKTYFSGDPPHDLIRPDTPSPPFHQELCEMLRDVAMSVEKKRLAVCAPRSHAKSVWVTNIFPVWLACYREDVPTDPYWVIVGDKEDSARKQLDIVKLAIESNETLRNDFGDMRGAVWNSFECVTSTGVKFEACGINEGIRGTKFGSYRPSKLFDDVETDESAGTPGQIEKIINKFDRTWVPLGDPMRSKDVIVGTIISYGSLLNQILTRRTGWKKIRYKAVLRFPDRMDLWQQWEDIIKDRSYGSTPEESTEIAEQRALAFFSENRDEMMRGAEVLWPERMPLYELMGIRVTNRLAFNSEQQNSPLDEETKLFKPENFRYYRPEDVNFDDMDFAYALDPSVGKNKRADFSAIVVVAKHRRSGLFYVVEADIRRRSPDQTITDLFEKHKRYRFKWGWCEGVAFQEFLRTEIQRRSAEANLYVPADEFKTGNRDKELRISGIEGLVNNGYVLFLPTLTDLLEALEYFPRHDRRDGPDALSMVLEGLRSKAKSIVWGTL